MQASAGWKAALQADKGGVLRALWCCVQKQEQMKGTLDGELATVLSSIAVACKQIASLVTRAGISNLTGMAGAANIQVLIDSSEPCSNLDSEARCGSLIPTSMRACMLHCHQPRLYHSRCRWVTGHCACRWTGAAEHARAAAASWMSRGIIPECFSPELRAGDGGRARTRRSWTW